MSRASPDCNAGRHDTCPGYYLTTQPCGCPCHQPTPANTGNQPDP